MSVPRFPGEGPRDLSRPLEQIRLLADERHHGRRLDQVLGLFLHWRSRTKNHLLIRDGWVELDGRRARKSAVIRSGDVITVRIPPSPEPDELFPADLEVPVLHADRWMIAVDKPAGLAVHPAGRRVHGTLIHHLHRRYRRPDEPDRDVVPRLLHRLDRETSGVVAAGLEDRFHAAVRQQFEDRSVAKVYLAVVHGAPEPRDGRIDFSIGPDRGSEVRLKMAARRDGRGLAAVTRYRTLAVHRRFALLELEPETGRTHQLRVHLDAIGCPIVGDKIYGVPTSVFLEHLAGELTAASRSHLVLDRHALHAHRLTFHHPFRGPTGDGESLTLEAPLPPDMAALLAD